MNNADLELRVRKLERQNRTNRVVIVVLLLMNLGVISSVDADFVIGWSVIIGVIAAVFIIPGIIGSKLRQTTNPNHELDQ